MRPSGRIPVQLLKWPSSASCPRRKMARPLNCDARDRWWETHFARVCLRLLATLARTPFLDDDNAHRRRRPVGALYE